MKKFFIFLLFLQLACCQQSSKIGNVGYGVFLIIFSIVLAGIVCLLGRATRYPEIVCLISIIPPIFFIIFFALAPKEAERTRIEQEQFETDRYVIPRFIYLIIFIITFLCVCCGICKSMYMKNIFAVRVGTIDHTGGTLEKIGTDIETQKDCKENTEMDKKIESPRKVEEKKPEPQQSQQELRATNEKRKIFRKKDGIRQNADIEEEKKFIG